MKHIYTLSVAFFFFSLPFLSAQSDKTVELSYTDEVGTVHTFPLTYYGKLGGRNAYTDATDMTGVLWRNKIKRWEILDHEGELAFFSTLNSISNPPELVTGNWQTVITGYTLDVFRGSGTYVALSSEMSNKVDISCNGQMDGGIMVAASQGRPPYKFSWSNGTVSTGVLKDTLADLSAGSYSVTITDSDIGRAVFSTTIVEPDALVLDKPMATDVTCNGETNGSATTLVQGGSAPYAYQWSNGVTTADLSNVPAGNYRVTVTDANDCSVTNDVKVDQPQLLNVALYVDNKASCDGKADGAVSALVSGGPEGTSYAYAWSNGETMSFLWDVPADTYSVTITDDNNCTVTSSVTIPITDGPSATLAVDADVTCQGGNNGAATMTVENAAEPLTYAWSNGATTAMVTDLAAGEYTVTATDANSCTVSSKVTIREPEALTAEIDATQDSGERDGSATVTPSGGTGIYTYTWNTDPAETTPGVTDLMAGEYAVTITDENGCSLTESAMVRLAGDACGTALAIDSLLGGELDLANYSRSFANAGYAMDTLSNDELTEYFGNDTLYSPVYFSFTGDGNIYHIRTTDCDNDGALADTRAALFAGACSLDSLIRRSDNYTETDSMPLIEVSTEVGEVYTLLIDAADTTRGNFCLSVMQMATVPTRKVTPQSISVYPNPTLGTIRIDNLDVREVSIFDGYGRRAASHVEPGNEVDMSDLPTGMYYLRITDRNNDLYTSRVVKQ